MKYFYTTFVLALFILGFAASDEGDDSSTPSKYIGTYVGVDNDNTRWTFVINSDNTMTAEGDGKIHYGSWDEYRNYISIKFSGDTYDLPRIAFKIQEPTWVSNHYYISSDGFLYGDYSTRVDNHDPRYRFKVQKKE